VSVAAPCSTPDPEVADRHLPWRARRRPRVERSGRRFRSGPSAGQAGCGRHPEGCLRTHRCLWRNIFCSTSVARQH